MTRHLTSPAMVCAAALVASGCAVRMNASAHVDRTQEFSIYRTYQWGPADALPTGDARLDSDPFFKDRMQGAVEKQLRTRGLVLADGAEPDLIIHYHAAIRDRVDVNSIDRGHGYCGDPLCTADITTYEAGTLVLDAIDRRTQKLIWRGWAQTAIEDALRDRAALADIIDQAAARIVDKFPRVIDPPVR